MSRVAYGASVTSLTPRLPLITISIVRTISFTIYTSTRRIINSAPGSDVPGVSKPWMDIHLNLFNKNTATDVALTSLLAGAASGAVVCLGSAPFELVKVSRSCSSLTVGSPTTRIPDLSRLASWTVRLDSEFSSCSVRGCRSSPQTSPVHSTHHPPGRAHDRIENGHPGTMDRV